MIRALIVPILVLSGSFASASPLCEAEMSPPSRAVYILLKDAATLGMIEDSELRDFISFDDRPVPLSNRTTDINNLDINSAVTGIYEGLSQSERQEVRQMLASFLLIREREAEKVETARQATKWILSPKLLPEFQFEQKMDAVQRLSPSEVEGRPVYLGKFRESAESGGNYLVVDPFHPNLNQRIRALGPIKHWAENHGPDRWSGVVRRSGKDFAGFFDDGAFFDIANGSPVTGSEPGLYSPKVAAELEGAKLITHLVINGQNLVIYVDWRKQILVYNIDQPNAKPERIHALPDNFKVEQLQVFQEAGKFHLLVMGKVEKLRGGAFTKFLVIDLEDYGVREFRGEFTVLSEVVIVGVGGEQKIAFYNGDYLSLGSFKTLNFERVPVDLPSRLSNITAFQWEGDGYLAFATRGKSLLIYDIRRRKYFEQRGLIPRPSQLHALEYEGLPYLLLRHDSGTPNLIRLVNAGPGSEGK